MEYLSEPLAQKTYEELEVFFILKHKHITCYIYFFAKAARKLRDNIITNCRVLPGLLLLLKLQFSSCSLKAALSFTFGSYFVF